MVVNPGRVAREKSPSIGPIGIYVRVSDRYPKVSRYHRPTA